MGQLEDLIRQNRHHFDEEVPFDGHLQRFETKIRQQKRNLRFQPFFFAKAAAIVVLVLLSSLWVYEHTSFSSSNCANSSLPLSQLSPDLAETEVFLTSQISRKMTEVHSLYPANSTQHQNLLVKEFAQMDTLLQSLCADLNTRPNDQRIIDAMILHYQTKIGILDRILSDLKSQQSPNSNSHETVEL
jgi:hypothetical protein